MTETNRKEELSISYLNALCACAGIDMEQMKHDDDSRDVMIKALITRNDGAPIHTSLQIQLKSTSQNLIVTNGLIHYPLKIKNYNDLKADTTVPIILALLILPEKENDWLKHTIDELIIRKCMYWIDLSKCPDVDNEKFVTVYVPETNYMDCNALKELLNKIAEEGGV